MMPSSTPGFAQTGTPLYEPTRLMPTVSIASAGPATYQRVPPNSTKIAVGESGRPGRTRTAGRGAGTRPDVPTGAGSLSAAGRDSTPALTTGRGTCIGISVVVSDGGPAAWS